MCSAKLLSKHLVLLILTVLIPWCLSGQTFTSSITGAVTDPSGAPVSGAKVTLKNMGTNDARDLESKTDGTYQFNNLPPGTYQVAVTNAGFSSYVRDNLILQAGVAATVNVALQLGNVQQKVEVTDSAVLVDTQTANTAITMNSQLLTALPNATRNPLNFVFAIAGTTEAPGGQFSKYNTLDQMSSNFGLNGGRTGDESVLIDGAPSQAIDWGGLMVSPLQDSVQEEQVVQNTYDAQYERAGAGIVSLVTKGGGNRFHGEAYDFLQNSVLDANYWGNNRIGAPLGELKQNQFGGNFSGPILKRYNLFFFGGYEGLRLPSTQSSGLLTVPTQAERQGNFSGVLNSSGTPDTIYNPFTTTSFIDANGNTQYTRQAFTNNSIPQTLINPVGQKILNLYPLPNRPGEGPDQINNYYAQGKGDIANDKSDIRIDWDQSSINRVFVRWSDRWRQDVLSPCYFCNGADTGNTQADNGFQVVLNDTLTPSPTWVVDSYISYSRWKEAHTPLGYGVANASSIGLSPSLFQAEVLPTISADYPFASLGNGQFQAWSRYSGTAQMNVTKQFGSHTMKFGGNIETMGINTINESVGGFSFSSSLTSCDPQASGACEALNTASSLTGSSFASMLLGTSTGGSQGINIDPAMDMHVYGLYIQDQWRIGSRLTVNAGLRYENQRPATERYNRLMYFDPNAVNPISSAVQSSFGRPLLGQFEYANTNGNDRYQWGPDNTNFAPRAGLAYKITDRLVARLGAGIFFLPSSAMISFDDEFQGFSSYTNYIGTTNNGFTPLNLVSNPFPYGINQPAGAQTDGLLYVGDGAGQIWPKGYHPTPYTEQWSFDLQYQVTPHSVFGIGYNGNRGRKLLYGNPNLDADQLSDQYLGLGAQLDNPVANPFYGIAPSSSYLGSQPTIAYNELLRPYPEYTYLQWTRSLPGARSTFNALDVRYNLQFSSGLSLLTTYQWSKAMDNGPEDYFGWATGNSWRDADNTMLDYNISTHDVPQSFATALVYDLPYGSGKRWGSTAPAIVRKTIGNWQLSSTIRLASGLPLVGAVAYDYSSQLGNYGFPAGSEAIANLVGNPVPTNRSPDNWINPAAYTAPATPWTIGNAPQRMTQLRERAARNVDLSVSKNLGNEKYQAWLRGDFLNAFNYAQYNSPQSMCVTCTGFGQMTGTENQPRVIQLSLKLAF